MRQCAILYISIALCALAAAAQADNADLAARWDFNAEETTPLALHGSVERDQAGPVPPEYPDFTENNLAVRLNGTGYLALADPGPNSAFDFTNGDSIALEAWVNVDSIADGQPMYIVGKGRTNTPGFARDNQNWALRLVGVDGACRLGFLFATPAAPGRNHWHRWTSNEGFMAESGWHHVAITYQFGKPTTIRGWIDGQPSTGRWDMGGATAEAPVVDDDAIWIGSALGGSPGNSFHGFLDAVAVHRTLLDDKTAAARFNRVGGPRLVGPQPEVMPVIDAVPAGTVVNVISEGFPTHKRWLNDGESWPAETARWTNDSFLLPRIPQHYDDWGIRDGWKAPILLQMAADVTLPPGSHTLLLRARALSRLWVDGKIVARTEAMLQTPPNGEEPVTPLAEPPLPGHRVHGYRMQEVTGDVTIAAENTGTVRVVLETVVGGKGLRTETGETSVALRSPDGTAYHVLRTDGVLLPLTDQALAPELARVNASLDAYDDRTRRTAAASQDAFWQSRHETARAWAEANPAPPVPAVGDTPATHPIDAFIEDRIQRAIVGANSDDAARADHFHNAVLPILRDECFRCHSEKEKGGLRLNSRESLLQGGDSDAPAVVPGDITTGLLLARIRTEDEADRMPPTDAGLAPEQVAVLEQWIADGAPWPAKPAAAEDVALAPPVDDAAFLRRLYFDTVGVPASPRNIRDFLADPDPDKRARWVDRQLDDPRCADNWMGYWQDMLAENPTLINASLNSTGPFRWFIYEAFRDRKPIDRLVTELIMLRGGRHEGGSAGFAMAAENDAPFAAKGHIVASAFLGINMECARCHDSPYHSTTQRDLFSLAAMFERKSVSAPASSSVPATFFASMDREPLIKVTLKPGEAVEPVWPFTELADIDNAGFDALLQEKDDTRERLAAAITAPQNTRFAQVMVNRLWKRFMGAGMVEPLHDWEGHAPSHPNLLDWLARELITHDYDLHHVMRLILTSKAYQREATGNNLDAPPETRYFNAPDRRRLTAEQIVDALHVATGAPMRTEELTFVYDGRREINNRLTLGTPDRAWMFASLANERDRPSLTLPRAVAVVDVLQAFGWTGARQQPIAVREVEPNVLQPGILANGTLAQNTTRASYGSELADLAANAESAAALVDTLFLRFLGRLPAAEEHAFFTQSLAVGFESRLLPPGEVVAPTPPEPLPLVHWFNHLRSEANTIQKEIEERVRRGPAPDPRFRAPWRKLYEDVVWSLVNHREFVWTP